MADTAFERYYDEHWLGRDAYFAHHRSRFLQTWQMLERSVPLQAGCLLDVAGVGPIGAYLATRGWDACGSTVDLRGPLPIEAERFDLVLCTEVIEHVKDRDTDAISELEAFNYSGIIHMLRELRRVMRPAGRLLVTTPNACSLHTLSKWLNGQLLLMDPHHVREFTPSDLERVATESGLLLLALEVVDSWARDSLAFDPAVRALLALRPSFSEVERGDNILAVFVKSAFTADGGR